MQKEQVKGDKRFLVGLQTRTKNQDEMNPLTAKIWPLVQSYHGQQTAKKIKGRIALGTTICAYTAYESDCHGEYTYFIGEEVTEGALAPEGLSIITVPAQTYTKFTTDPAPIQMVELKAWQDIWMMSDADMGGKRAYKTDFVIYDQRAQNFEAAVLDLYIGIVE